VGSSPLVLDDAGCPFAEVVDLVENAVAVVGVDPVGEASSASTTSLVLFCRGSCCEAWSASTTSLVLFCRGSCCGAWSASTTSAGGLVLQRIVLRGLVGLDDLGRGA